MILRCSFVIRKAGLMRLLVVVPAGTPTLDISGTELRKRLRTGAVRLKVIQVTKRDTDFQAVIL